MLIPYRFALMMPLDFLVIHNHKCLWRHGFIESQKTEAKTTAEVKYKRKELNKSLSAKEIETVTPIDNVMLTIVTCDKYQFACVLCFGFIFLASAL